MAGSTTPNVAQVRTKLPSLEAFLEKIDANDSVGPWLRYNTLYDEVRLARQEDDPRLSMGIWQTDLKKADWSKIENLCVEALIKETKDLQIAAWLTEAWLSLDGLEGYSRGMQLLTNLCDIYWQSIHPNSPDDADMESRYMIFEWLDTTLSSRLLFVPVTYSKFDSSAFGLGHMKSAQHIEAASKRNPKSSNKADSRTDPSKNMQTIEDFQKSLDQTPNSFLENQQQNINVALQTTTNLKNTLVTLWGTTAPSFSQLLSTLKEMERLVSTNLQKRQSEPSTPVPSDMPTANQVNMQQNLPEKQTNPNNQPISNGTELKNRNDAYRQLAAIASFLEQNDPHSLAPQLIRQLIRWENKNILDIFKEIAQSPQEFDILMKLLGSSAKK